MLKRIRALVCVLGLMLLTACQAELYTGLTEEAANEMLAILLKRGIEVEKINAGKNGCTISVNDKQVVRALQILHEHSLPREQYANLGKIFAGGSMISSNSEEKARLTYAISQELADTFSRIDGVLMARVHVVLEVNDPLNNIRTPATATVFLRHTSDSIVTTLVSEIRKATATAVSGLDYEHVTVMLVPVRVSVTVPMTGPEPSLLGAGFSIPLFLQTLAIALLLAGLGIGGVVWYFKRKESKQGKALESKAIEQQ